MNIDNAIAILNAIEPLAAAVPVAGPALEAMIGVATQVCEVAGNARANREAYEQLANEIAGYASAVSEAVQSNSESTPGTESATDFERERTIKMIDSLRKVFDEAVEAISQRKLMDNKRRTKILGKLGQIGYDLLHQDEDKDKIEALRSKVKNEVASFHIGVGIRGLGELQKIKANMETLAADQSARLERIQAEMRANEAARVQERQQDTIRREREAEDRKREKAAEEAQRAEERRQDRLVKERELMEKKLSPVLTACFDGNGEPEGCLPNTREELLEQIKTWIFDESSPDVFCLTGLAGTGKTTIARSVCIDFPFQQYLASFIISRNSADRQIPEKILQTIIYQLGVQHEAMGAAINRVFEEDWRVTARPVSVQISSLFTEPINTLQMASSPILIVIDALDECNKIDSLEGGNLIPLLTSAISKASVRIKLLITSREEPRIMKMFKEIGIRKPQSLVQLHRIEDSVVEGDIRIFYRHHLGLIAKEAGLADTAPWPCERDFDLLIKLTGKLFVYASLVARILKAPPFDPEKRLEEILRTTTSFEESMERHQTLDDLYFEALKKATTVNGRYGDKELVKHVRRLVGTLVVLQSPLNTHTLSRLLGVAMMIIKQAVENLSAVLMIPEDDNDPITIFHLSFSDFVVARCLDKQFRIDMEEYHSHVLHRSLIIMNEHLKHNICKIEYSSLLNEEIEDLEEKRKRFLPYELRYACEYWMVHLSSSKRLEDSTMKDLATFCGKHLFHWLEVLSLLDKLSVTHIGLPDAIIWCKNYTDSSIAVITLLLEDVERVVHAYNSVIRISALQLYSTVLFFMPHCNLYERTKHEYHSPLEFVSTRPDGWPPRCRILEGHKGRVCSVAFSPDGTCIASGSTDDTVRVWDVVTGQTVTQFKAHAGGILSVSYSPDGVYIASGSHDKTIWVWSISSGNLVTQLKGHTGAVRSVAFSPDGKRIASGSDDHTVRVWDAKTGGMVSQLEGHTEIVNSVAFSPDGTCIVSGSSDGTVRVWDTAKQQTNTVIKLTSTDSVSFSNDGSHILSGSINGMVQVWDATTGNIITQFEGHASPLLSVAFSPDESHILSGSWDRTVQLWDAITGNMVTQFDGHSSAVWSVAFSPDGKQIASASLDGTVRVWDATTANGPFTQPEGHKMYVSSVAISPDRARTASASGDRTVGIWDTTSGSLIMQLEGHTNQVTSVVFSHDGTRIASGSNDETVRVWDSIVGNTLTQLIGHTDWVSSVAFTPDGRHIASGSQDETVRIWDAVTGVEIKTLKGHSSAVTAVAFSLDGTQVASGSYDGILRVWDTITGDEVVEISGNHFNPKYLMFSDSGTQITSEDEIGDQRTWDVRQHRPINGSDLSLVQHPSPPLSLSLPHSLSPLFPAVSFRNETGWLSIRSSLETEPRRACWIPPERRGVYQVLGDLAVFGDGLGRVTMLRAHVDAS